MKYITKNAAVYNDQGHIDQTGISVIDDNDRVIIGATEHLKDDLIITECEINPVGSDTKTMWSVKW